MRYNKKASILFGMAALYSCMNSVSAKAEELWDPYLRGVFEGLPAGALPPPGLYGELDNYYTSYSSFANNGNKIPGTNLNALVEVPILLWVPGIKILGGSYAAGIGQPFDYNSYQPLQRDFGGGGGNFGIYNTILMPGALSWSLPRHLFIRAGLTILLDDATNTMSDLVQGKLTNGGAPSGNGYTTIQPDFGVSWLYDGWNISIGTHYAIPVTSDTAPGYSYRSAPEFSADYTVMKEIGRWGAGLGGEQEIQIGNDTLNGQTKPGTRSINYGIGPIASYEFQNGLKLTALWNHNFAVRNDVAGDFFDLRLTTRF
ncbi:SphA family protein [Acidocella aminolytica]|jgi:hypothetical protein|uniref:Phenol degradation protein meta n=2 Tax=Acidocella TaxID=50709 RepID=A0A0D6PG87_9PROT|nr:transporter [Acidocella aminolytica]GAN79859.1 hypothetical protein Aam_034_003 [Acidocella aminolytica 101 = DSM 11237]GBQ38818.1 hypothetical protein AA11237_1899 [Acidocella aminolytica 101 = DSM 11237]SHE61321.1 Uncharacterized conserved protein [Acidocella aminolytica 101 = DSM 11237]